MARTMPSLTLKCFDESITTSNFGKIYSSISIVLVLVYFEKRKYSNEMKCI